MQQQQQQQREELPLQGDSVNEGFHASFLPIDIALER